MKTRDSGMPDESVWAAFFQPEEILRKLGVTSQTGDVADLGCGYGTFTIPAARIIRGRVFAFDLEPEMVEHTAAKAAAERLANVVVRQRDFAASGTGLPAGSVDTVFLFNILHAEEPEILTGEAFRIVRPGGSLAVLHWRYDPTTPRGPDLSIRPRPEQCIAWCRRAGFEVAADAIVDLPPYHYGFRATKRE